MKTVSSVLLLSLALAGCQRLYPTESSSGAAEDAPREVDVSPAPAEALAEDAELARRVKRALLEAPGLNALGVDVSSADALVILKGSVATPGERERVVAAARAVDGAAGVVASLAVRGSSPEVN